MTKLRVSTVEENEEKKWGMERIVWCAKGKQMGVAGSSTKNIVLEIVVAPNTKCKKSKKWE